MATFSNAYSDDIAADPEALVYDGLTGGYIPRWVAEADEAEDLATERDLQGWYERQVA